MLALSIIFLHLRRSLFLLAAAAVASVHAAEPVLEIEVGSQIHKFARSGLSSSPAARTIDIPSDVAYKRAMRYRAVPLSSLVPHLNELGVLQFTALDGFVANIPAKTFAAGSQAWVAIEPADAPWPALASGHSAGPFYLVWLDPQASAISQELWPYQIVRISQVNPLAMRFPQLVPNGHASDAARRGLQIYAANCSVCHQVNGGGDGTVGPDLNKPFSPTEYLEPRFLRKLIRNPASVRYWNAQRMPGFGPDAISDAQLDDLLAYLRQMAAQR